jgi:hypothetical protein
MQQLSDISRIIPRPYLDLPTPIGQSDSSLYSQLTEDGSTQYETAISSPSEIEKRGREGQHRGIYR